MVSVAWDRGSATAAGAGSGNGPPGRSGIGALTCSIITAPFCVERRTWNIGPCDDRPGRRPVICQPCRSSVQLLIDTVNAAEYPLLASPPVMVAVSEERLSAKTMSLALEVGFRPFAAYTPAA